MFSVNQRTRTKHITKASSVASPDQVREIAYGNEAFSMNSGAWTVLGIFGAIFTFAALNGVILVPGFLVIIIFMQKARPQRIVAVSRNQILVMSRGSFVASPKSIVAAAPLHPIAPHGTSITVGDRTVQLKSDEIARLAQASMMSAPLSMPTPDPSIPYVLPASSAPGL